MNPYTNSDNVIRASQGRGGTKVVELLFSVEHHTHNSGFNPQDFKTKQNIANVKNKALGD